MTGPSAELSLSERWEGYRQAGHWPGLRVDELADRARASLTLSTYDEQLSLAQARTAAVGLAEQLRGAGITEGSRVFLLVSDALGDIVLLLALSRVDAVIFFSPPGQADLETGRMLARSAASVVVSERAGAAAAQRVAGQVPGTATITTDWRAGAVTVDAAGAAGARAPGPLPESARIAAPTRFVTFTSGTTGEPKGIQHNGDTLSYAGRWAVELAAPPPGAVLAIISIAHAAGLAFSIMAALAHDRDLAVHHGKWNPARVVDLIAASGATYTLCTPTHVRDLLDAAQERAIALGPLIASVGGAPVPPELVRQADAAGVTICRIFGLSECPGHTSTRASDPLAIRMGTEGRSYPGTEDVALGPDGRPTAPGTTGELGCRGPSLFFGYLGERRLADRLTADGWFRTGDLVAIDGGMVTVKGRLKDIIIRGGDNIDPVEVEGLLLQVPGVARVAVLGVPDARLGERLAAVVQPQPGCATSPEVMLEHLAAVGVPKFKWPEVWRMVDALPVNETGKVDKKRIRQAMEQEADAALHQHRA